MGSVGQLWLINCSPGYAQHFHVTAGNPETDPVVISADHSDGNISSSCAHAARSLSGSLTVKQWNTTRRYKRRPIIRAVIYLSPKWNCVVSWVSRRRNYSSLSFWITSIHQWKMQHVTLFLLGAALRLERRSGCLPLLLIVFFSDSLWHYTTFTI